MIHMSGSASVALAESGLLELQHKYNGCLGREDSLKLAIEAAEIHLKALRLTSDGADKKTLKTKTLILFEEAEKIKKGSDFIPDNRVYELVFGAGSAKESISISQSLGDIQQEVHATKSSSAIRTLLAPVSSRPLSVREQKILLEGSVVNGAKFPIWKDADNLESFDLAPGQEQFMYAYDIA